MPATPRLAALRRFPVKGLSPEDLTSVAIAPGRQIAGDRAFAIENGPSGFDPKRPAKLPKFKFLCLMRNARLARLRTVYNAATGRLTVACDGAHAVEGDLRSAEGRAAIESWFADFMAEERRGPLRLLPAPANHTFSDTSKGVVSLINLASVAAIEDFVEAPVDPLRFRGNLDIEGLPAWAELEWVGRTLTVGEVKFRVVQRTVRCAATDVDPTTAARNLAIPSALLKRLGHADCGVYAEPLTEGVVRLGDRVTVT